jgi:hypothetical protein
MPCLLPLSTWWENRAAAKQWKSSEPTRRRRKFTDQIRNKGKNYVDAFLLTKERGSDISIPLSRVKKKKTGRRENIRFFFLP